MCHWVTSNNHINNINLSVYANMCICSTYYRKKHYQCAKYTSIYVYWHINIINVVVASNLMTTYFTVSTCHPLYDVFINHGATSSTSYPKFLHKSWCGFLYYLDFSHKSWCNFLYCLHFSHKSWCGFLYCIDFLFEPLRCLHKSCQCVPSSTASTSYPHYCVFINHGAPSSTTSTSHPHYDVFKIHFDPDVNTLSSDVSGQTKFAYRTRNYMSKMKKTEVLWGCQIWSVFDHNLALSFNIQNCPLLHFRTNNNLVTFFP
jgi:hypothetical protein